MKESNFSKIIGRRILSEANDLKRTVDALAKDLCINKTFLENIIQGECTVEESYEVINKMGATYPIDVSDLYLIKDDCINSVKIFRAKSSINSRRIFNRLNNKGKKTPYYEYRDTAMSIISPYKPEWIKQLRCVADSNPHNPDVIYNNGHFMHQITFFVGPVNFYWEVDGKKYCREMNTGDSNYITPYWPHSFTNRDPNQEAYILAVTFGGDVRRAQKELYVLGNKAHSYVMDYRQHSIAVQELIKQHMNDENITSEHFQYLADKWKMDLDIQLIFKQNSVLSIEKLTLIAKILNIELKDLLIPDYKPEDEVAIKHVSDSSSYIYPHIDNPYYKIYPLVRTSKMPQLKGFSVTVLANNQNSTNLEASLHTYLYNYGDSEIVMYWQDEGNNYQEILKKDDSVYIQPFIKHGFSCTSGHGKLLMVRIAGNINLETQRELSYMANIDRVFNETKCWFD